MCAGFSRRFVWYLFLSQRAYFKMQVIELKFMAIIVLNDIIIHLLSTSRKLNYSKNITNYNEEKFKQLPKNGDSELSNLDFRN